MGNAACKTAALGILLAVGGVIFPAAARADEVTDKLDKTTLKNIKYDPSWTLADALDFLGDRYAVKIETDTKAFDQQNVKGVLQRPVQLEASNVTLAAVLKRTAAQVGGTYRVEKGTVRIVPNAM